MKIKRLTLHNYRGYSHEVFDFMDGLNVLSGEGGCLSGDTIIRYHRHSLGKKMTIEDLYHKENNLKYYLHKKKQDGSPKMVDLYKKPYITKVRSLNEEENYIQLNDIAKVIYSGEKELFEVTLEDGKSIKATKDHKFRTSVGWVALETLTEKHLVMVDNTTKGMKTNTSKDHNHSNNSLENLQLLTKEQHDNHHAVGCDAKKHFRYNIPEYSKIVSIKKLEGLHHTYDISCEDPHNSFVANGIMVHNSGKSAVLKGMYFLLDNNQDGHIHSHWALNDKGKLKRGETTYVELETYDGDIIRREKGNSTNTYSLNGKDLENFRTGVPEEIAKVLNMGEVNTASQFESHFLLADKGGAVAKTLNRMVDLEIIDKSVKDVNALVKAVRSKKKVSDEKISDYEKDLDKYAFIDDMERDLEALSSLWENKESVVSKIADITKVKENITTNLDHLSKVEDVVRHSDEADKIASLFEVKRKTATRINDLANLLENIDKSEKELKECREVVAFADSASAVKRLMDDRDEKVKVYNNLVDRHEGILTVQDELATIIDSSHMDKCEELLSLFTKKKALESVISDLDDRYNSICDCEDDIADIKKSIKSNFNKIKGLNCPQCGNILKEDVC